MSYTKNMSEIKEQIFQELTAVEDLALRLRGMACNATKQTDLEVAILTEQVKNLKDKNQKATERLEKALDILKKLK